MAYPEPPVAPRTRPVTVTVAVAALIAVALFDFVNIALTASMLGKQHTALANLYENVDGGSTVAAVSTAGGVLALVVSGLIAVTLLVLAFFDALGKNAARIATWVVGGVFLCCAGCGGAGTLASGSFNVKSNPNGGPDPSEVAQALKDIEPGWYRPVSWAVIGLVVIFSLLAVILLALPASNAYFRKPTEQWQPPMSAQMYPPVLATDWQPPAPSPGDAPGPFPAGPYSPPPPPAPDPTTPHPTADSGPVADGGPSTDGPSGIPPVEPPPAAPPVEPPPAAPPAEPPPAAPPAEPPHRPAD